MTRLAGVLAAILAIGCGGKTDDLGGGGSGGGGAASGSGGASGGAGGIGGASGGSGGISPSGGSGGVPSECSVPVTEPGAYPLTINFVNPGDQPLFLRQDCTLGWSLKACADGYTASLPVTAGCTTGCTDTGSGCIACGACMQSAIEVTKAAPVATEWTGFTYTFGQTAAGCQCHDKVAPQSGKYAIEVPVYSSENAALTSAPAFVARAELALPSPSGAVDVVLQAQK